MSSMLAMSVAIRVTLVLGLVLLAMPLLGRASAALRRLVLLLGLGVCGVLPPVALAFPDRPALRVAAPSAAFEIYAEALAPDPGVGAPEVGPRRATERARGSSPAALAGVLWLAGAGIVLLRLGVGLWRGRALIRRATREPEPHVRLSHDLPAPAVVGIWRPQVLLPAGSRAWSSERRRAVLAHELAHVRRRDGLALCFAQLVTALHWFQPLAWLALTRLRRECELAADEDAVAAGMRPSRYAEHLLAVARDLAAPHGALAMARPSELARRVAVLVGRDRPPTPLTPRVTALALLGGALVLAAVTCTEASAQAAAPAPAAVRRPDRRLQAIVEEEVARARSETDAERVAVVVLDPMTGAVLAERDDRPRSPIVPASTLKPLVVALALEAQAIQLDQRFDCGGGKRSYGQQLLRDAGSYRSLTAAEILAVSSNVGLSRVFDALGGVRLANGLARFQVAAIEPPRAGTLLGAVTAIGQRGVTTTPLALARAYAAFANGGWLVGPDGERRRVISETTATRLRAMLEGAVAGERATGKAARIAGARVAGKTGTSDAARIQASFVGFVPVEQPRFVIYTGLTVAGREGSGGSLAAPLFARIASRALSR